MSVDLLIFANKLVDLYQLTGHLLFEIKATRTTFASV